MKHLTYMNLEFLATLQLGLLHTVVCRIHIKRCALCRKRYQEVIANQVLAQELREMHKRSV